MAGDQTRERLERVGHEGGLCRGVARRGSSARKRDSYVKFRRSLARGDGHETCLATVGEIAGSFSVTASIAVASAGDCFLRCLNAKERGLAPSTGWQTRDNSSPGASPLSFTAAVVVGRPHASNASLLPNTRLRFSGRGGGPGNFAAGATIWAILAVNPVLRPSILRKKPHLRPRCRGIGGFAKCRGFPLSNCSTRSMGATG